MGASNMRGNMKLTIIISDFKLSSTQENVIAVKEHLLNRSKHVGIKVR